MRKRTYHEQCLHELHASCAASGIITLALIAAVNGTLNRIEVFVFGLAVFAIGVYGVWTYICLCQWITRKMPRAARDGNRA